MSCITIVQFAAFELIGIKLMPEKNTRELNIFSVALCVKKSSSRILKTIFITQRENELFKLRLKTMETEQGKIVDLKNGKAVIEMEAGSQCTHCGARHACSAMGGVVRQIEIPVKNNVKVGDRVTISYQSQSRIVSALLVFLLPVLFLIAGYFVGFTLFGTEGKAILVALAGLVIAFILNWGLNKVFTTDSHFLPMIVKIIK